MKFPQRWLSKFLLLGYRNPVHTSQETHYISATESSRLMLCKIWGFQGGYYEEWRLLGYKNPVRTSQETHYVSATESSRLMLCKIRDFHGGDYEECRLLGYKKPVHTSQETQYICAAISTDPGWPQSGDGRYDVTNGARWVAHTVANRYNDSCGAILYTSTKEEKLRK
jgi:hypothetical protein